MGFGQFANLQYSTRVTGFLHGLHRCRLQTRYATVDIALFPYFHSPDMSCVVILQTILIAVCVSKEYQEEVKNVLILKLIFAKY